MTILRIKRVVLVAITFAQMAVTCSMTSEAGCRPGFAALQMVLIVQSSSGTRHDTAFKQIGTVVQSPHWRQWFQTAEITAVAARPTAPPEYAQFRHRRLPLRPMKMRPLGDNPGACTAMNAHQNRVLAILTPVVFRQRRATDIVS